ncbi:MAG: hypothetical protein IT488_10465 [Gammaproteobacteria bacterium]|nr:hypothetical protein [Gammaproteobacteria bacterium]
MAYSSTNPARKILDSGIASGGSVFIYESTHPHATIEGASFFAGCGKGSHSDSAVGMQVADLVIAVNQSTAGTSAITMHRVSSLTTSTGWASSIHATVSAAST